jgi:putative transposase
LLIERLCNKGTALAGPKDSWTGDWALAPAMSHPGRNASSENIVNPMRTFFVTTKASMGRRILQSERNASLLIDVLRSLVAEQQFKLLDFVVKPDHLHALLTVQDGMTAEKAMELIKGRFSRRLKQEAGYLGEVWQRGFTEVQIMNSESLDEHRRCIAENPLKARLVESVDQYPFCFQFLASRKLEIGSSVRMAGAKALIS